MSGLYGGRGNYTAKLKIYDIGYGGPEPDDGDLIFEMPSYNYTCKPKYENSSEEIFELFDLP